MTIGLLYDASVMYVGLHQYPCPPGTGSYSETGIGNGKGATLNCPMSAGSDDDDYRGAFMQKILPAIDKFAPDRVILSAGFDAHYRDPLAQMDLTTPFYKWMTQRMPETADKHSQGRLISLLEGGYDITALSECVAAHVAELAGQGPH